MKSELSVRGTCHILAGLLAGRGNVTGNADDFKELKEAPGSEPARK